jgi:ParB-like chromosome segregation protein Spo0J
MTNVENIKPRPAKIISEADYDNLAFHDLAAMMDLIEGRAFEDLKADIATQGILQPIVLYEGKILDGRNRYRAAKAVSHNSSGPTSKCSKATPLRPRLMSSA